MNISSIGSYTAASAATTQAPAAKSGRHGGGGKDFDALAKALQSGDLSAAQDAFATLQADAPSGASGSSSSGSSQFKTDVDALKKALDAGDLAGAQQAFATIQSHAPSRGNGPSPDVKSGIDALGKALSSGDLSAAQAAFKTLTANASGSTSGTSSASTTIKSDVDALSKALSSGSLKRRTAGIFHAARCVQGQCRCRVVNAEWQRQLSGLRRQDRLRLRNDRRNPRSLRRSSRRCPTGLNHRLSPRLRCIAEGDAPEARHGNVSTMYPGLSRRNEGADHSVHPISVATVALACYLRGLRERTRLLTSARAGKLRLAAPTMASASGLSTFCTARTSTIVPTRPATVAIMSSGIFSPSPVVASASRNRRKPRAKALLRRQTSAAQHRRPSKAAGSPCRAGKRAHR